MFAVLFMSPIVIAKSSFNDVLLKAMRQLNQGGGYSVKQDASDLLKASIFVDNEGALKIVMSEKGPTFCSGATYLAFLKAIENSKLTLAEGVPAKLRAVNEQEKWLNDGHGFWGRWNANGPGTAMAVKELDLGINFRDDGFYQAKAGDFLKIFWTEEVGKKEKGHSVIFTRVIPKNAKGSKIKKVCYWSSQGKVGIGEDCAEREKIKNMIFSRITKPWNINKVSNLSEVNDYLAGLLKNESSFEEAVKLTGTLKRFPE